MLGSEGIFGVITDVGVRIRPLPERKRYEGWFAPGFAEGIEIVRSLAQAGALPDVVRLSDREETRGLAGDVGAGRRQEERRSTPTCGSAAAPRAAC